MDNKERKNNRALPFNSTRKAGRRLRPVIIAMMDENVSISDLADKLGLSRQSVNRWFQVDDIRFTSLEEMVDALGYELEWRLVRKAPSDHSKDTL